MSTSTDWLDLRDTVCVVTGAGSGIGAGTARALAAAGAAVAVLDRDAKGAAAVAEEIERSGARAISLVADVSDVDQVARAAEQAQRDLGPCRVLVNNAALVGYAGPLMTADLAQWSRMLDVNLTGALVCTRAFGGQMVAEGRGGSVINVASICGHIPLTGGGAYSVGKAGLMMLTRLLALELAGHGIRCNSVSPGLVHTPATAVAYDEAAVAEARSRMVPAGRIAGPADLADVITFLASARSSYVDGQDILVDGALSQTLMALVPRPTKPMTASGQ